VDGGNKKRKTNGTQENIAKKRLKKIRRKRKPEKTPYLEESYLS
jgi:hypothetical protein